MPATAGGEGTLIDTPEGWITLKQAAQHLGLSTAFLRKQVRKQAIPFSRAGSKVLRFKRSELDRWLESNGSGVNLRRNDEGRSVLAH